MPMSVGGEVASGHTRSASASQRGGIYWETRSYRDVQNTWAFRDRQGPSRSPRSRLAKKKGPASFETGPVECVEIVQSSNRSGRRHPSRHPQLDPGWSTCWPRLDDASPLGREALSGVLPRCGHHRAVVVQTPPDLPGCIPSYRHVWQTKS